MSLGNRFVKPSWHEYRFGEGVGTVAYAEAAAAAITAVAERRIAA